EWGPENWNNYYDMLRNNEYLLKSNSKFHQGVALTMRGYIFGMITDLWGDAPYTEALQGDQGLLEPQFDSQETIYKGIIEELKAASSIFALNDNTGYLSGYDTYYGGDPQKWQKFSNSLLLRYYMRISEKLPDLAKSGIRSEEHTSELQSRENLVCRLLLEKKKKNGEQVREEGAAR